MTSKSTGCLFNVYSQCVYNSVCGQECREHKIAFVCIFMQGHRDQPRGPRGAI